MMILGKFQSKNLFKMLKNLFNVACDVCTGSIAACVPGAT